MPQRASGQESGASKGPWIDRAIDILKPQPGAPRRPVTPPVHKEEWHKSVERKEVVPGLTVHEVGLSVFGETRSFHDRGGSNESISVARQKIAHAMINDAELSHLTGKLRNKVHDPVEPAAKALANPKELAAYHSAMSAAREAYLNGYDPTKGAIYINTRPTPDRSNRKFQKGSAEGVSLSTQSGPYDNSFQNREVPSRTVWLNTYFPDEHDKKIRKKR